MIKSIGLDYYIQPIYALDRISLHNAYFPETTLQVIGFGRDSNNEFKIIVEQPFIEGSALRLHSPKIVNVGVADVPQISSLAEGAYRDK